MPNVLPQLCEVCWIAVVVSVSWSRAWLKHCHSHPGLDNCKAQTCVPYSSVIHHCLTLLARPDRIRSLVLSDDDYSSTAVGKELGLLNTCIISTMKLKKITYTVLVLVLSTSLYNYCHGVLNGQKEVPLFIVQTCSSIFPSTHTIILQFNHAYIKHSVSSFPPQLVHWFSAHSSYQDTPTSTSPLRRSG